MTCDNLLTLVESKFARKSQVFHSFIWPPNPSHASWVTSFFVIATYQPMIYRILFFFCEETRESFWSLNFSTLVYLRVRFARSCVHLRRLANFGRKQICTQVDVTVLFGYPPQVTQVEWLHSLLWQPTSQWNIEYCELRVLATLFGQSTRVSTQLRLLVGAFGQGLKTETQFCHLKDSTE